jgi:hypothetical protein
MLVEIEQEKDQASAAARAAKAAAAGAGPLGMAQQPKRVRGTVPTGDTPEKKKQDRPMNAAEKALLQTAYDTRGWEACFTPTVCAELAEALALGCESTKTSKQVKAWFEALKKKNKKALVLENMGPGT